MGRPREFDVDQALQAAMELFWRKGYEGTSLSDLTEGMGVTRPSLYAAFGNKEELFRKALARYQDVHMAFLADALAERRARDAVERLLMGFADAQTCPQAPHGCLGINAAIACSQEAEDVQRRVIAERRAAETALVERLERARTECDLPQDCDPEELARYVMTIAQGMAVQAASGADREALHGVITVAMRGWPT